ncbi:P2Y purinoceptor 1 isoform X3 [Ahaetulla prasina]|uniref:P2Y purinoceptor 1 isoform X3 n=1 Tax=Ahaetulla prasina TaxID=499056 RepID=UPI002648ADFE|nr:P2Y purinoceptor 1 isoform X3 [Ahaetulla prasina]
MGSPLSPVIANLYMEHFETQALEKSDHKPKLWLRYVDDTFIIWPHGKEKLDNFLTHLNSLHPKIQFTMETEVNNQLPFLDVLVYRKPNGSLGHTIYQKKTHTNRYLHALSHHHPAQINSVVKTLISRTKRLADEQHLKTKLYTLTNVLTSNGFKKLIQKEPPTKIQDREQENGTALLPYIKGITDRISKILHKHNIKTAFCTNQKISTILRNLKDKTELENQGVYEIPCTACPTTYIGQTNRRISARIEKHKNSVKKEEPTSSLVQHLKATGHDIDFKKTRTIAKTEHFNNRIIREAIKIEKRPHSMNK